MPDIDHNERKLRDFARDARKFIKASDALLNAQTSLLKHDGGTPAHKKAWDRVDRADAAYEQARVKLEGWIEAMIGAALPR